MATVAKIDVMVGANTAGFVAGMRTVDQRLQQTQARLNAFGNTMMRGVTLPAIAAAGAIGGLVIKAGQWADELLDLSAATGVSVEVLQEWRTMAVFAGTATDAVADAVMYMNRQMRDANTFSRDLTEAAGLLGVALHDELGTRAAEAITNDLLDALRAIEDPIERAELGARAFGRRWESIAPIVGLTADELERIEGMKVFSEEELQTLDAARQAWDVLKHEIWLAGVELALMITGNADLADMMENTVKPAIENIIGKIEELIKWWRDLDDEHKELIKTVGLVAIAIGPASKVAAALFGLGRLIHGIVTAITILTGGAAVKGSFAAMAAAAGTSSAAAGVAAGGGFLLLYTKLP